VVLGKGAGKREGRKTVVGAAVPGVEVGQPEDEVRRLVDDLDVESRNALLDLVPEVRILVTTIASVALMLPWQDARRPACSIVWIFQSSTVRDGS